MKYKLNLNISSFTQLEINFDNISEINDIDIKNTLEKCKSINNIRDSILGEVKIFNNTKPTPTPTYKKYTPPITNNYTNNSKLASEKQLWKAKHLGKEFPATATSSEVSFYISQKLNEMKGH